jgi:hypothetical protein
VKWGFLEVIFGGVLWVNFWGILQNNSWCRAVPWGVGISGDGDPVAGNGDPRLGHEPKQNPTPISQNKTQTLNQRDPTKSTKNISSAAQTPSRPTQTTGMDLTERPAAALLPSCFFFGFPHVLFLSHSSVFPLLRVKSVVWVIIM